MSNKFPFIANEFIRKRALVTGGTAGIGEAVASRLLDGEANVITTSRNSKSDREEREHFFIEADLSTPEGCTKVINKVNSQFGGVDILVNVLGASSAPMGGFSVLSDEEWQKELNINLLAAVRLDRGLLPAMIKQGSGLSNEVGPKGVRVNTVAPGWIETSTASRPIQCVTLSVRKDEANDYW